MDSFAWTEELNIGFESIDNQHKTMVSDIRNIHEAITKHVHNSIVKDMFDKLIADSKVHFSEEEHLMLIYNYPAIGDHVKQHEIFIEKISNCKYSYDPEEICKMQSEILKMNAWLVKHILEYDKQYMERFYI